jgi:hypothetical protein
VARIAPAYVPGEARKLVPGACRDRNDNVVVGFARSGAQTISVEFTEKEKRLYALIEPLTRLFSSVEFRRGPRKGGGRAPVASRIRPGGNRGGQRRRC